jgi:hypothetical protein
LAGSYGFSPLKRFLPSRFMMRRSARQKPAIGSRQGTLPQSEWAYRYFASAAKTAQGSAGPDWQGHLPHIQPALVRSPFWLELMVGRISHHKQRYHQGPPDFCGAQYSYAFPSGCPIISRAGKGLI